MADSLMPEFSDVALPRDLSFNELRGLAHRWPPDRDVCVRLHRDQWVNPAGIVGLACLIDRSRRQGSDVIVNCDNCVSASYWRRMDFFDILGLPAPVMDEARRPAHGRFLELRRVNDLDHVDALTEAVVSVINPNRDFVRTHRHIVSEALNNVCQHAYADGFCSAQYYPKRGQVRLCIGDYGIGLRQSLTAFAPENDQDAIDKAVEVGVTGRPINLGSREVRNRGVGLSAIHGLVTRNGGELVIWSGTAIRREGRTLVRLNSPPWQGTLISVTMPRDDIAVAVPDVMKGLTETLRAIEKSRQRQRRLQ